MHSTRAFFVPEKKFSCKTSGISIIIIIVIIIITHTHICFLFSTTLNLVLKPAKALVIKTVKVILSVNTLLHCPGQSVFTIFIPTS